MYQRLLVPTPSFKPPLAPQQQGAGEMRAPLNSSQGPPVALGLAHLRRHCVWPKCGEQKPKYIACGPFYPKTFG